MQQHFVRKNGIIITVPVYLATVDSQTICSERFSSNQHSVLTNTVRRLEQGLHTKRNSLHAFPVPVPLKQSAVQRRDEHLIPRHLKRNKHGVGQHVRLYTSHSAQLNHSFRLNKRKSASKIQPWLYKRLPLGLKDLDRSCAVSDFTLHSS